jgi:hypothetical protein
MLLFLSETRGIGKSFIRIGKRAFQSDTNGVRQSKMVINFTRAEFFFFGETFKYHLVIWFMVHGIQFAYI